MSLDVYLTLPGQMLPGSAEPEIWIRDDGRTKKITRAEWDARFPDREPVMLTPAAETDVVYHGNITHNLSTMARAAGLYAALWESETHGWATARQLIEPLRRGRVALREEPARYEALNPPNGWGSYAVLVQFTTDYLAACEAWPDAHVHIWR